MEGVFEVRRALEIFFYEKYVLQEKIVQHLERIEKQNRVLISIFGAAAKQIGNGK